MYTPVNARTKVAGGWLAVLAGISALLLTVILAADCQAAGLRQKRFATPEQAALALVEAAKSDDLKGMLAILGPGSRELIYSGDGVADNAGRDRFVAAYEQKHTLAVKNSTTRLLQIGADDWPLPIPIVKRKNGWGFDAGKGKQEILKRRVGRNELRVIEVLDAYVDAQQEYASKDCRGGGKVEFAQCIISSPGTHDGLYWEDRKSEQQSPLGPLMARAAREGYDTKNGNRSPFYGYYFKVLTGQGPSAVGGSYQYVVKGRMILGFAMIAYPAEYGNSGVMTFMVNQAGVIYEKNLGKGTLRLAERTTLFNPGKGWKKVTRTEPSRRKIASPAGTKP
ncbi:MAG: DUF2950 domain-containing protein [Geobacteraceae bacterium]|nr:DUF2950 domain-containing protein [Geobacteraceae bacterium]